LLAAEPPLVHSMVHVGNFL